MKSLICMKFRKRYLDTPVEVKYTVRQICRAAITTWKAFRYKIDVESKLYECTAKVRIHEWMNDFSYHCTYFSTFHVHLRLFHFHLSLFKKIDVHTVHLYQIPLRPSFVWKKGHVSSWYEMRSYRPANVFMDICYRSILRVSSAVAVCACTTFRQIAKANPLLSDCVEKSEFMLFQHFFERM